MSINPAAPGHSISARLALALPLVMLAGCADTPNAFGPPDLPSPAFSVSQAGGQQNGVIPDQFIVQFRDHVSDVPGLAQQLARQSGGELGFVYTAVLKGYSVRMSPQAAAALQLNPNVLLIEPDVLVATTATETQTNATWGLDRVDQRPLPLNSTYVYDHSGAGVTVYIVDTGIRYTHTEFEGRASFGFDAFGGNGSDCHGHGTHVAGTVGGKKYGVAKAVKLVAVRVLDCNGSGSGSGVIAGLDWVAKSGARPGVVNMSLGGGANSSLDDAVKRLFQAGIGSAVSAGNSNTDACKQSPARAAEAMTVGASDSKDVRASFSNYGSCVDWFAPGVSVTSAFAGSDTETRSLSGTSMSSPHTAGAAALFLARNPGATPQQVRDGLFSQASKGAISQSNSANNHLLYSLPDLDNTPVSGNNPPTADYSWTCVDLDCSFTDWSMDFDGAITKWKWDFMDGTTSSDQHPKHTFQGEAVYQVKLTVTDDGGETSWTVQNVAAYAPRKITLSAKPAKVKGVTTVTLTWTGATSPKVDIYRNNGKFKTVDNTSSYVDNLGKGQALAYPYQVCEAGTSDCSRVVYPSY